MLLNARKNIKDIASMPLQTDDPRFLKIKYDASQYITDNLDKAFTKRKDEEAKQPITINLTNYGGKKTTLKPLKPLPSLTTSKTNDEVESKLPDSPSDVVQSILSDTPLDTVKNDGVVKTVDNRVE